MLVGVFKKSFFMRSLGVDCFQRGSPPRFLRPCQAYTTIINTELCAVMRKLPQNDRTVENEQLMADNDNNLSN